MLQYLFRIKIKTFVNVFELVDGPLPSTATPIFRISNYSANVTKRLLLRRLKFNTNHIWKNI